MAEHANDGFLLYLLDMAILEANRRARSRGEAMDDAVGPAPAAHGSLAAELKVVR